MAVLVTRIRETVALVSVAMSITSVLILPTASESQGSVPTEVAAYASDPDGLVATLSELFGLTFGGAGIVFDSTTEVGQLNRVFTWTPDFLAGTTTDTPAERLNQWTTTIVVEGEQLGVATIWINPATVKPELAEFTRDLDLAAGLADVATEAFLIHDVDRMAWFTLVGPNLTPIVSGQSGIAGPTTLEVYQRLIVSRDSAAPSGGDGQGSGVLASVLIVGATLVGTAIVLFLLQALARRKLD